MSLLIIILQIIKYIAFIVGFIGGFFIGIGIVAGLYLFYMTFRTLRFRFEYIKKLKECKRDPSCSMSKIYDWCCSVAVWGDWDDAYVVDHICEPYFRKYAKQNANGKPRPLGRGGGQKMRQFLVIPYGDVIEENVKIHWTR